VALENQLQGEQERLAALQRQFEELQVTLRRYEAHAKKDSSDPQMEPAGRQSPSSRTAPHHQEAKIPAALSASGGHDKFQLQLVIDEVERLRATLADREDVICRQTNEIRYLQGKCNELQRLVSAQMDSSLDFAAKYKQTLEKTTNYASPMLLDGKSAEQVAWQSSMDIAKMFSMPVKGLPTPASQTQGLNDSPLLLGSMDSSIRRCSRVDSVPQAQGLAVASVVYMDNLSPADRLRVMQQTTVPTAGTLAK
jgi:hypothetical protein